MAGLKEEVESNLGGRRGPGTEETQDKPLLASRHTRKSHKNNSTTTTDHPTYKRAKESNRPFSKEDTRRAKKPMKRHPASLIIRETQIEATTRHHLAPVRVATIKEKKNSVGNEGGLEPFSCAPLART